MPSSNVQTQTNQQTSGHQQQQQQQQQASAMQYKALTFPAPANVQTHHHQSASSGMPTSVLTSLKMSLKQESQQQQQVQGQGQPSSATSNRSLSTRSMSPDSALDIEMPLSPASRSGELRREDSSRRAGHIHAEQKRRCNIKNGFDMLHSLIPQLHQNPNAKLSKAAMLQKGAEYIRQLKGERTVLSEKMEALRQEIDALNNSLK